MVEHGKFLDYFCSKINHVRIISRAFSFVRSKHNLVFETYLGLPERRHRQLKLAAFQGWSLHIPRSEISILFLSFYFLFICFGYVVTPKINFLYRSRKNKIRFPVKPPLFVKRALFDGLIKCRLLFFVAFRWIFPMNWGSGTFNIWMSTCRMPRGWRV